MHRTKARITIDTAHQLGIRIHPELERNIHFVAVSAVLPWPVQMVETCLDSLLTALPKGQKAVDAWARIHIGMCAAHAARTGSADDFSDLPLPTVDWEWEPVKKATKTPQASETLVYWRNSVNEWLKSLRTGKGRESAFQNFQLQTVELGRWFGMNYWQENLTQEDLTRADRWWLESFQTTDGRVPVEPVVSTLATAARGMAATVERMFRKGQVDPGVVRAWLAITLKLMQVGEKILSPGQEQRQASRPQRPKPKRSSIVDPCKPPKKRPGSLAKCRGDWDSVLSCVVRSGGIKIGTTEAAEAIHAAGGRKHLPPKLLRKDGQSISNLAYTLTEEGYIQPDEFGRQDESAALERIVSALRGENTDADPGLNQCAAKRLDDKTWAEYKAQQEEEG